MSKKKSASNESKSDAQESVASDRDAMASDAALDSNPEDSGAAGQADTDAVGTDGDDTPRGDTEDVTGETTEVLATDEDPVQIGEIASEEMVETRAAAPAREGGSDAAGSALESGPEPEPEPATSPTTNESAAQSAPRRGLPWFGLFNLLLIAALAAAAYYYWRERQAADADYQAQIEALQVQVDASSQAVSSRLQSRLDAGLQSGLAPLESDMGALQSRIDELGLGQKDLRETSVKLFELYGRDKNDWQLAEVEYLMRVAQHKLILQDDFEGAAITLQAASDRIGLTGDPGLLPVRMMISEEIADLKTRRRADLVGMTLKLAQLGRQVRGLQPGFALRVDEDSGLPDDGLPQVTPASPDDWIGQFVEFLDSLVTVRKQSSGPTVIEANIVDVTAALEDNLKLARWAVLERDARQYQLLIDRSLQLFREFYDLDNAANQDFISQLQELQKMVIRPEKPDITGSLREMQRILSQRENAPPDESISDAPDELPVETPATGASGEAIDG